MRNQFKIYIKNHPVISVVVVVLISVFIDRIIMCFSANDLLKVVPSTIIGLMTLYIAFQQHVVAKDQKKIAEDKHKLELFEKRFETYQLFLNMALWSHKVDTYRTVDIKEDDEKWVQSEENRRKIRENADTMISLGEQSRFLFGEDVFSLLGEARADIFRLNDIVSDIRKIKSEEPESKSFINDVTSDSSERISQSLKTCHEIKKDLSNFYSKELPKVMGPYLKIAPYKNNDVC